MATDPVSHLSSLERRTLLRNAAGLAAGILGAGTGAWARDRTHTPTVVTAWNTGDTSWAGLWTPGKTSRGIALPARAHQLLALPGSTRQGRQVLVLARRPGEYLLRMDPLQNKALRWHTMEDDRYLGGHAVLATDGHTFFTTETDGETGQGLIAERDLHTLERLREFPSGGIGPHAVLRESAGTLLVANGGILNLPETGRRKLNLGRMDSNLTRLDAATGAVLARYRLTDPYLSLRHLAQAPDGTVGVALQAEHPERQNRQRAPALALLRGEQLHTVPWPAGHAASDAWDGYAGDVCYANARFWISAPHAGWLLAWNAAGELLSAHALPGVGALAGSGERLLAGGDHAALAYGAPNAPPALHALSTAWDNHAMLLSASGI